MPTAPAPSGEFAVLAASAADLAHPRLAAAMGRALGLTEIDGARAVRRSRGILREAIAEEEARRTASLLEGEGIGAFVADAAAIPVRQPARALRWLEPVGAGIAVRAGDGEALTVAWERVVAICVGHWWDGSGDDASRADAEPSRASPLREAGATVAAMLAWRALPRVEGVAGLPTFFADSPAPPERPREECEHVVLDLLVDGAPDRFRIDRDRFDYSGLGDAMARSSRENLCRLVEMLAAAVPDAARNGAADRLLGIGVHEDSSHRDEADFLREQRWIRAVRSHGRADGPRAGEVNP